MTNATSILAQDPSIAKWMDFDLLRNEGIGHLAELSGDVWTDHNLHDPGITILEVLCYALTDLGHRNSLPIKDLLAKKSSDTERDDNFFTAAELLTCNPLTVLDYRKLLMNIEGVRNAWLEPVLGKEAFLSENTGRQGACKNNYLNGLYNVVVELDAFAEGKSLWEQEGKVNGILKVVNQALHSHRNLCEDFHEVFVLGDEEISILADIEINPDSDPDDVLLRVMVKLQNFLSPQIPYYTLKELLAKKKRIEDVFLGRPFYPVAEPNYNYGFIDTEELEKLQRKTELHSSDFYREIMEVEGVRAIRKLRLFNFIGGLPQTTGEEWCLRLSPRLRPVMAPLRSEVRFFKNSLEFAPDKTRVNGLFRNAVSGFVKTRKDSADLDWPIPKGQYREDLGEHFSIQHDFPLLYRVGAGELPDSAPMDQKAKKQQLKGYLLFFDQLLADYLAQLGHLRDLFQLWRKPDAEVRTRFFQPLEGISDSGPDIVPELHSLLRFPKNASTPALVAEPNGESFRFATQEACDLAVARLVADFKAGRVAMSAEYELSSGRYRYVFSPNGRDRLVGPYSYGSDYLALEGGEALNFYGTLAACYEKTLAVTASGPIFSFRLGAHPLRYADYLSQITEQPDEAENRRTRFLNHLLARFAEEFTDYSLLMYALENGKKRKEKAIIADKETFLANYPAISRNRGRGFHYKKPMNGNASGLEFRVAGLLGILNRNGDTAARPEGGFSYLANIELSNWKPQYFAVIKNTRGQVVLEGVQGFESPGDIKLEGLKIRDLAKNAANYEVQKCTAFGLFGLLLKGGNGELVARHPATFGSEQEALEKRDCLRYMAAAEKGYQLAAKPLAAKGWFSLLDDTGGELLNSTLPYADLSEARSGWHHLVRLLQVPGQPNFKKEGDARAQNFTFCVVAENGQAIARNPRNYCTTKARTAALDNCRSYIAGKKLNYKILPGPAKFRWYLAKLAKRNYLLESAACFASPAQAQANQAWLGPIAKKAANWHKSYREEDGMYGYYVQEPGGYVAARSPWFRTDVERDEAEGRAQAHFSEMSLPFLVEQSPVTWAFQLYDNDGHLVLRGGQEYGTQEKAQWAFYEFTEIAADSDSYCFQQEAGSCRYSFFIPTPSCGPLAAHPVWYATFAEAEAAKNDLAKMVDNNRLRFRVGYAEKSWQPEIHWENAEGWCVPLLVGTDTVPDKERALKEAQQWADGIAETPASLRPVLRQDCHGFHLKWGANGKTVARHPVKYAEAAAQAAAHRAALRLLENPMGWTLGVVERWSVPSTASDAKAQTGFRLVKKGKTIALHPHSYSAPEKRDQVLALLTKLGGTGSLPYSEIAAAQNSVRPEGYRWRFVIKDKQADGDTWWESPARFYSEEDAIEGFQQNFLSLLDSAADEKNYALQALPECKWKVVLLAKGDSVLADMPGTFSSKEAAGCAIETQVRRAKTYPFFREGDLWRFRTVQPGAEEDALRWTSSEAFPDLEKADRAFQHFLLLATYAGNYARHDRPDTQRYGIELREVLLESTFQSDNPAAVWENADHFSRLADEEGAFYPFLSTEKLCCFGFRVVKQGYVLARHSRRYLTAAERETALHRLHAEAVRRLAGFSDLSIGYCQKGGEVYFRVVDNATGEELWRSAAGFPTGKDDPAAFAKQYYEGEEGQLEQYRNFYLTLFEHARFADFYQPVLQEDGQYRLALKDASGKVEWLNGQDCGSKEACYALAAGLIRVFRRQPILKEDGLYFFQYYSFDEDWAPSEAARMVNGIVEPGKILWESSQSYESEGGAGAAFKRFLELLADDSNYQRTTEQGGTYHAIELTDPAMVLATHPLAYCDQGRMSEVMGQAMATLDAEGFRLVEHILLRPRKGSSNNGNYLIETCADPAHAICFSAPAFEQTACGTLREKEVENCLVPFADPYSFWMTAVIPFWPRRFQHPDFRRFFENTLRRETPAHIALNILWVSPEQMGLFEEKYQKWLTGLRMEEDCLRNAAHDDFVRFLFQLPGSPSFELDADELASSVILDETRLTF